MPDIFSLIGRSLGAAALLVSFAATPISIPEAKAQDTRLQQLPQAQTLMQIRPIF